MQAVKLRASSAYYNDAKPCRKYTALFSWILCVNTEERKAGFNFRQFVTLPALLVFLHSGSEMTFRILLPKIDVYRKT